MCSELKEHDKSVTKLRQEFDKNAKELHLKYERRMKQLRQGAVLYTT
jgi:hypothetical protein